MKVNDSIKRKDLKIYSNSKGRNSFLNNDISELKKASKNSIKLSNNSLFKYFKNQEDGTNKNTLEDKNNKIMSLSFDSDRSENKINNILNNIDKQDIEASEYKKYNSKRVLEDVEARKKKKKKLKVFCCL